MKRRFFSAGLVLAIICFSAFAGDVTPPEDLPEYYAGLDNKSKAALWTAVQDVTQKGYKSLTYDGLWSAYYTSDVDADGNIIDMYGGYPYKPGTNQCGSYGQEGDCYNREHSIPKSWFGGSKSEKTPGSDLFHVVPTDGYINNARGNDAFGEVSTATKTFNTNGLVNKSGSGKSITIENTMLGESTTVSSPSGTVFECDDLYKGDFARGYFGTLLKWGGVYSKSFTSGAGGDMFTSSYTESGHYGLTEYGLALLLKWHRQDPVSQKEIDRNNGIQNQQGNRNPFIDYPDLAEYIWGNKAGEVFMRANVTPTFPQAGSAFEEVEAVPVSATKIMQNGVIYIQRNGHKYTIHGVLVE